MIQLAKSISASPAGTRAESLSYIPPEKRAWLRAQQIEAFKQLAPRAVLANFLNVSVILLVFWHDPHRQALLIWAGAIAAMMCLLLYRWQQGKSAPKREVRSVRAIHRAMRDAALLALCWAWLPVGLLPHVSPYEQSVIALSC
jgi:hypothetical protein